MTDIIFSFDTEDFTSSVAADAVYREAEILRKAGIKGGFCIVGLLASQLEKWGRTDVLEALRYHEIGTHSYGHSLHPTINEYTDLESFDEAYRKFILQEQESVDMIKHATGVEKMLVACPPGNQKSYVAMYGYSDMNIPVYADTFCDTADGKGVFYCNIYHVNIPGLWKDLCGLKMTMRYIKFSMTLQRKRERSFSLIRIWQISANFGIR